MLRKRLFIAVTPSCLFALCLLLPGELSGSEEVRGFRGITFQGVAGSVPGVVRHRHTETTSTTELFVQRSDGQLLAIEGSTWLEPAFGVRVRVSVAQPAWWIEVVTSYPQVHASSRAEANASLEAADEMLLAMRTSEVELGSGKVSLSAANRSEGLLKALESLVDPAELRGAIPGEVVEPLLLLYAMAGSNAGMLEGKGFALGWPVTEFVSRHLGVGEGYDTWRAIQGEIVGSEERLGEAELDLLRRAEAAGLAG